MTTPMAALSPKEQFLTVFEQEHEKTMRVLRAFPADQAEMKPHERLRPARELAFVFALERGLATLVFKNAFASGVPSGPMPTAPDSWDAVVAAAEQTHRDFVQLVRATSDEELQQTVKFFVAPKTLGDFRRIDFLWFILHDEIHHRGQFSIYLRMAGGKVPSIYGPSGDEPWF